MKSDFQTLYRIEILLKFVQNLAILAISNQNINSVINSEIEFEFRYWYQFRNWKLIGILEALDLSKTCVGSALFWSWVFKYSSSLLFSSVSRLVAEWSWSICDWWWSAKFRQNISRFRQMWNCSTRECRHKSQEPRKIIPSPPPLKRITRRILMMAWELIWSLLEPPGKLSFGIKQPSGSKHFTVHSLTGSFSMEE